MLKINEIYHGDCLEVMKEIDDDSIDMILCDLPYGTTACSWDTVIPFETLWEQYKRITKDNAAIVLTASQPFTSALVMSNIKMFKYEWIWEKEQGVNFLNSKHMPLKIHENILVFSKGKGAYIPVLKKGRPFIAGKGESGEVTGKIKKTRNKNYGTRNPITILKINRQVGLHPTQKPVDLFQYLIKTYTSQGALVLDNCAGSGTTGVACKNLGRNFILIEKEEKYFKDAKERLENTPDPLIVEG